MNSGLKIWNKKLYCEGWPLSGEIFPGKFLFSPWDVIAWNAHLLSILLHKHKHAKLMIQAWKFTKITFGGQMIAAQSEVYAS